MFPVQRGEQVPHSLRRRLTSGTEPCRGFSTFTNDCCRNQPSPTLTLRGATSDSTRFAHSGVIQAKLLGRLPNVHAGIHCTRLATTGAQSQPLWLMGVVVGLCTFVSHSPSLNSTALINQTSPDDPVTKALVRGRTCSPLLRRGGSARRMGRSAALSYSGCYHVAP